jgi:hypothetical protein
MMIDFAIKFMPIAYILELFAIISIVRQLNRLQIKSIFLATEHERKCAINTQVLSEKETNTRYSQFD